MSTFYLVELHIMLLLADKGQSDTTYYLYKGKVAYVWPFKFR